MRRPGRGRRRKPVGKHLSISANDADWGVVGRNAARLGLSKARYLVGLVKRDASEEEDRGPYMALAPEEQRELLEAMREVRAPMLEEPPAREPDTAAASREASPPPRAGDRAIANRLTRSDIGALRRARGIETLRPDRRRRMPPGRELRMRRSPAGRASARAGFCERLMVAKVRPLKSSAAAVSYYEKDGYYAKDDPEHRDASFWHGGAAKDLGLKGHVLPGEFEDLLAGWVPGTEIRLGRTREGENDHRPGWDITLSAPKSVSLEGLVVGDRRVIRAHDDAVRATLKWIETDLLQTRGWDPMTRQRPRVAANGMIVAGFRHVTSRIGDPQLHTHCVLANMTRNAAGEWRSVELTKIRRSEKLIGAVYRNELARRLQALGMAVTPRMIGRVPGFELAGYDRSFMDAFSGRRAEILAYLKEHDLPYNAKNAEMAALHTRQGKKEIGLSQLVPQWRERAREFGLVRDRGALRPDRPIDPATGERVEPVEVPPPDLPANELRRALSEQIGLSRLARSLSVQECKTPSGISTVRPRSSGSL